VFLHVHYLPALPLLGRGVLRRPDVKRALPQAAAARFCSISPAACHPGRRNDDRTLGCTSPRRYCVPCYALGPPLRPGLRRFPDLTSAACAFTLFLQRHGMVARDAATCQLRMGGVCLSRDLLLSGLVPGGEGRYLLSPHFLHSCTCLSVPRALPSLPTWVCPELCHLAVCTSLSLRSLQAHVSHSDQKKKKKKKKKK